MPTWNKVSDETRVAVWRAWKDEGLSRKALAMRFKYSLSAIDRCIRIERGKRHAKVVTVTPQAAPPITTAIVLHKSSTRAQARERVRAEVLGLRAQGFTLKQIGDKLNMSNSGVNYYISGKGKTAKPVRSSNEGAITNGQLNKNVAVGIVYAEVERFLSALSQRLGVSATILRPRLSELLGHSPFRQ